MNCELIIAQQEEDRVDFEGEEEEDRIESQKKDATWTHSERWETTMAIGDEAEGVDGAEGEEEEAFVVDLEAVVHRHWLGKE